VLAEVQPEIVSPPTSLPEAGEAPPVIERLARPAAAPPAAGPVPPPSVEPQEPQPEAAEAPREDEGLVPPADPRAAAAAGRAGRAPVLQFTIREASRAVTSRAAPRIGATRDRPPAAGAGGRAARRAGTEASAGTRVTPAGSRPLVAPAARRPASPAPPARAARGQARKAGRSTEAGFCRPPSVLWHQAGEDRPSMADLSGAHGVIVGVANKRSISGRSPRRQAPGRDARAHLPGRTPSGPMSRAGADPPGALVVPCDVGVRRPDPRALREVGG
jgi:hypothetical protein